LSQSTFTINSLLNFKINRYFSVNGGGSYATFQSTVPVGPRIATVNIPVGVDYSTRHFGTGFQYQRTVTIEGGGSGNDYAVNVRASAGPFQATAFFRHDVQVPTLATIFSQIPGLQDALDRAGIVATTPEQIAELLRNTALLQLLGFTNAFTVDLAPSRNDVSADASWNFHGPSRRKVDLNYFYSNTDLLQGNFILTTATLSYSQKIHSTNDMIGSAALVRTQNNGVTTTRPLFSVSLQHRFFSVPSLLLPGRHGMIQGHIFRDDESSGRFSTQVPLLSGVEVRLDENRVTRTDSSGYYSFHHVPFGVHRVEARLQSDEPFFYTTDSPATADMNATIDFGINFAKGQIFGFLLNDAGAGINGIAVELKGEKFSRRVQTGLTGKFAFTGLSPGEYFISTLPDSYPPGYALQDLTTQTITVESGKPASAQFTARALRSLGGKVLVYDPGSLQTVPLAGAVVRLKELLPETKTAGVKTVEIKTGETGAYLFRNLAAGTYTVAIEHDGKEISRTVTLPATPANVRDIDLNAGSKPVREPKP
jgi:Carboxypeptidase regulatory-like domain